MNQKISREQTDVLFERIIAQIVDNLIVAFAALSILALTFLLTYLGFSSVAGSLAPGGLLLIGIVLAFALSTIYQAFLEYYWNGQTVGKRLTDIQVVKQDGGKIGSKEAVLRNLPSLVIIDFFSGILFYTAAIASIKSTEKRQRIFDRLTGTVVVER